MNWADYLNADINAIVSGLLISYSLSFKCGGGRGGGEGGESTPVALLFLIKITAQLMHVNFSKYFLYRIQLNEVSLMKHLFKVNNKNIKVKCRQSSKWTIGAHRGCHLAASWCIYCCLWTNLDHSPGTFIIHVEQILPR